MVLDQIFASAWPLAERRKLAAQAVRFSLSVGGMESQATQIQSPVVTMEEVLGGVQRHGKLDCKPSITEAKKLLRQAGPAGPKLASRVSRLSKARNVSAHPDVTLMDDIASVFSGSSSTGMVSDLDPCASASDASSEDNNGDCDSVAVSSISDNPSQGTCGILSEEGGNPIEAVDDAGVCSGEGASEDESDEDDESLLEVPKKQKEEDPYLHCRVCVHSCGGSFCGRICNMHIGSETKEILYEVKYDDGDVEHLPLKRLQSSTSLLELQLDAKSDSV